MDLQQFFEKLALVGVEWVVWLIVFLSTISIAVMVERIIAMYKATRINNEDVNKKLKSYLDKNQITKAESFLEKQDHVETRVALAGLREYKKGPDSAEEMMLSQRATEKQNLEKYLTFLGTVGNNAPFLGLFGTVTGIIKAFHALAITATPELKTLMFGVAEALVTTALGLIVAIPAVLANNAFRRQVSNIMTKTENSARIVMAFLKSDPNYQPPVDNKKEEVVQASKKQKVETDE
ncbi:MAG: MotA/TolQ/ExbB proton channel family protein [Deltaproteobacteria bacterium]|jgi:biopolymer transport protein ExbB/TolQ|nr:MotA/TolQ/ExbB proton channel family protein [Deltaproteobacteria bacterium]